MLTVGYYHNIPHPHGFIPTHHNYKPLVITAIYHPGGRFTNILKKLSILKEGFMPIFSATHKKTGVTFPICLGKRSVHKFSHCVHMAATLNITLWKC